MYVFLKIESDKFTTIEKLNQLENLKNVIEKKMKKVEAGDIVINLQRVSETTFEII